MHQITHQDSRNSQNFDENISTSYENESLRANHMRTAHSRKLQHMSPSLSNYDDPRYEHSYYNLDSNFDSVETYLSPSNLKLHSPAKKLL